MRQFYLSTRVAYGNEPTGDDGYGGGVCADGYHFASFWEIVDPSNLKYNTDLGLTVSDSGRGPPRGYFGWVRTGSLGNSGSNCSTWTRSDVDARGTSVHFSSISDHVNTEAVWELTLRSCNQNPSVWCVQD
jgi:hypothetical protein